MAKPSSIVYLCCFEMKDIRIIILHEKQPQGDQHAWKIWNYLEIPGSFFHILIYLENSIVYFFIWKYIELFLDFKLFC